MLNRKWLCIVLWGFLLAYLTYLLVYFLPRYYFNIYDQTSVYYGAKYFLNFSSHPIFALHYLRLGWLLNVPLVALHASFYLCCLIFMVFYLAVQALFYKAWISERFSHWLFPTCLFVGLLSVAGSQNFLFDYYTVTITFLMLSLALYRFAMNEVMRFSRVLMILSGVSFAIAAVGNAPLTPLMLMLGVGVFIGLRHRKTMWFLLSFIACLGFILWVYFIHWHILSDIVTRSYFPFAHLKNSVVYFQMILLVLFGAALVGALLVAYILPFRAVLAVLALLIIIAWNVFLNLVRLSPVYYYPIMLLLIGLLVGSIFFEYRHCLSKHAQRRYLTILLVGLTLMIVERATSRMGPGCIYIYLPLVLYPLLLILKDAGKLALKSVSNGIALAIILFTALTAFVHANWQQFAVSDHQFKIVPISINSAYNKHWGVNITPQANQVYNRLDQLYVQHDCAHKAFLALESMPMGYFMFNRLSPFNVVWISQIGIFPIQKAVLGSHLVRFLKQHASWCVIWRHGGRFTQEEKALHRKQVLSYVKANASSSQFVGDLVLFHRAKVWFYAK